MKLQAQPMIAVKEVQASALGYIKPFNLDPGHGGEYYEQLLSTGQLNFQLHDMDTEDEHGKFRDEAIPLGNGVLHWFEVEDFNKVVEAANSLQALLVLGPYSNPLVKHMEIRLRDPDGYRVVVAESSEYSRQSLTE
jgi:hypothetical protein